MSGNLTSVFATLLQMFPENSTEKNQSFANSVFVFCCLIIYSQFLDLFLFQITVVSVCVESSWTTLNYVVELRCGI